MSDRTACPACQDDDHDRCAGRTCLCATEHRWQAIASGIAPDHPHAEVKRLARAG
jgi:hypothetical protein